MGTTRGSRREPREEPAPGDPWKSGRGHACPARRASGPGLPLAAPSPPVGLQAPASLVLQLRPPFLFRLPTPHVFVKVRVNPPPGSLCHSAPPQGPCGPRVPDSGTISGEQHPRLDRAWREGCGSGLPFSGSPGSARHPVTLRGAADGAGVWSPRGLILRTQSLALGLCLVLPVRVLCASGRLLGLSGPPFIAHNDNNKH